MTKSKLLTKDARIHSSLTKDINRMKKNIYVLEKRCKDYKIIVKQLDKLFTVMLKDGRI